MRLIIGIFLVYREVEALQSRPTSGHHVVCAIAILAALFLLMGFRTSLAGFVLAATEVWRAMAQPGDPWVHILLATLAAGIAMIGPGTWSIDAYLSGWKRIDVPPSKESS